MTRLDKARWIATILMGLYGLGFILFFPACAEKVEERRHVAPTIAQVAEPVREASQSTQRVTTKAREVQTKVLELPTSPAASWIMTAAREIETDSLFTDAKLTLAGQELETLQVEVTAQTDLLNQSEQSLAEMTIERDTWRSRHAEALWQRNIIAGGLVLGGVAALLFIFRRPIGGALGIPIP